MRFRVCTAASREHSHLDQARIILDESCKSASRDISSAIITCGAARYLPPPEFNHAKAEAPPTGFDARGLLLLLAKGFSFPLPPGLISPEAARLSWVSVPSLSTLRRPSSKKRDCCNVPVAGVLVWLEEENARDEDLRGLRTLIP